MEFARYINVQVFETPFDVALWCVLTRLCPLLTLNVDRLAGEGMKFTRRYAGPTG